MSIIIRSGRLFGRRLGALMIEWVSGEIGRYESETY